MADTSNRPKSLGEFTLAEIEHIVDPDDKSYPKFTDVANLEFLMFPREDQVSGQSAKTLAIGQAVSQGIVNNKTLGYFIGRVYLFLTSLGISKDRLRFRQHLANEHTMRQTTGMLKLSVPMGG